MTSNITPLESNRKRVVSRTNYKRYNKEEIRKTTRQMLAEKHSWRAGSFDDDLLDYLDQEELFAKLTIVFNTLHSMSARDRRETADILVEHIYGIFQEAIEDDNDQRTVIDEDGYDDLNEEEQEEYSRGRDNW